MRSDDRSFPPVPIKCILKIATGWFLDQTTARGLQAFIWKEHHWGGRGSGRWRRSIQKAAERHTPFQEGPHLQALPQLLAARLKAQNLSGSREHAKLSRVHKSTTAKPIEIGGIVILPGKEQ